ncbi:hypothetical protein ACQKP8_20785 [Photobacterium alginatilyticum]|jgi:hypothetical protein|uniref:hypothetical protein n=1 Tax=Photobacterium alginatilyticum TaxID=1775171 RepID=UPI0040679D8F
MKFHQTALFIAALTVSSSVVAGVGLKVKAQQMVSEDVVVTEVARVQKGCGNVDLKATIDWSAWSEYDYKAERLNPENTARFVGGLVNTIYDDMVNLCTTIEHAELYKAEFGKITKLHFVGQESIKERDTHFSLSKDGKVMTIKLNGGAAYNTKFADTLQNVWG